MFADLPSDSAPNTIDKAYEAVLTGLSRHTRPSSLCKLDLSASDYSWLCNWALTLTSDIVSRWITPYRKTVIGESLKAGGLLMLLFAEVARREGREGAIWQRNVRSKFNLGTQTVLFTQGGQPTQGLKDVLEAIARHLDLRHVFGKVGTHNWYVSVFLQFGFTCKGLSQLPFWLAGQTLPEAVNLLLEGPLQSYSFQRLWFGLKGYRRGNLSVKQLHKILRESQWILGEWVDQVIEHCGERPDLGTYDGELLDEDWWQPILDEPKLVWVPPGGPELICNLSNLSPLDLTASHYDLLLNGQSVAKLIKQPDETYHYPETVALSCDAPLYVAELLNDQLKSVISFELVAWDPQDEVAVFELPNGRRIDPWNQPMSVQKSYALIAAADLTVEPLTSVWMTIARDSFKIYYLKSPWVCSIRVLLGNNTLWTPLLNDTRSEEELPDWAVGVMMRCPSDEPISVGKSVAFSVTGLWDGTRLDYVRIAGCPLDFHQDRKGAETADFQISPDLSSPKLKCVMGLRYQNEVYRKTLLLDLDIIGVTKLTRSGWEAMPANRTVTVHDVRTSTFRIFVPKSMVHTNHDLAILEGSIFSDRSRNPTRAKPLGPGFAGFGGALRISPPYNAEDQGMQIAAAVIDPGIIQSVNLNARGDLLIHLFWSIEPCTDHQIVCWAGNKVPMVFRGDQVRATDSKTWFVESPALDHDFLFVGVAFKGERLGAKWADELPKLLNTLDNNAANAAMIRWMHTPVLHSKLITSIKSWVARNPVPILLAWLWDRDLPADLQFEDASEEWINTVRQVMGGWRPTSDHLLKIIQELMCVNNSLPPYYTLVTTFMRIDPVLMGRLLLLWLNSLPDAPTEEQLSFLERDIAGISADESSSSLVARKRHLLEEVATIMHVDPQFIERGIAHHALAALGDSDVSERELDNLSAGLGIASCREYIALQVISTLKSHNGAWR
jgi:hypothetical protein